jgi:hypothetical protein
MEDEKKAGTQQRTRDEILKEAAAKTYTAVEAVELLFGAQAAERLKEDMTNPNFIGWSRLCELLNGAREDKQIASSPGASEFLELMNELAIDAFYASTAEEALGPLIKTIKSAQARIAANKGSKENKRAREWVISEWKQHKAEYRSKSDFARIYAKLVLNRFHIKPVSDRNIRERWLEGL